MDALSDIAVFVKVVDEGSFTAAAGKLNLSRPVVSKYISRLEERLGARLLNRTTRRLSLTEAGRIFYDRSRIGLQEIEEAQLEISSLQESPRGVLRVNSPMSFGIAHLAPLIAEFTARYPDVSVDMNLDDRQVDVVEEGYDVSVRIAQMPDSSLVARRVTACRHAVVASPAYLELHGTPRTPDDLRDHNILSYSYQASANVWHFIGPDDKPVSVPVAGTVRMNNSLALREALLGGAGIMRTPTFVIGNDIRQQRLVCLLPKYQAPEVSIFLVYPQRRFISPKVRSFVDFIAGEISDPPAWDAAVA